MRGGPEWAVESRSHWRSVFHLCKSAYSDTPLQTTSWSSDACRTKHLAHARLPRPCAWRRRKELVKALKKAGLQGPKSRAHSRGTRLRIKDFIKVRLVEGHCWWLYCGCPQLYRLPVSRTSSRCGWLRSVEAAKHPAQLLLLPLPEAMSIRPSSFASASRCCKRRLLLPLHCLRAQLLPSLLFRSGPPCTYSQSIQ